MADDPTFAVFDPDLPAAVGDTPAVAVDLVRLNRNIDRMARRARAGGVALRPHIKTHKSLAIMQRQLAAGAKGITASKSSEAAIFAAGGAPSVTIAYPLLDPAKIDRVLAAAATPQTGLRFVVDSPAGVRALGAAARRTGAMLDALVEVDVGLHRCGIDPGTDAGLALVRTIDADPHVCFAGLLSHAGQAYRAANAEAVRDVARTERRIMIDLAERLRKDGIEVGEVSVGSTPSVVLNDGFEGITEIRPGNYVFMDRTQIALRVAGLADIALWVVATVVSANDRFAIIDAGSKVLSSDAGPHGSDALAGFGLAWHADDPGRGAMTIAALSEEHGFVVHDGKPPAIGTRLVILPNHACPVANLARELMVVEGGTARRWPVDARGCVS